MIQPGGPLEATSDPVLVDDDQSDARYRGLLEAAPDAMVVVNGAGEIVLLSVQAEKQFGYHRDELVGQAVTNIIPVGFAERLIADDLRSAKIDQSFVSQITSAGDDMSLVTAVISMARSLKLRAIAEGVETSEQLAVLQALDCDEAQGFYFSRPVPAQEFAKLFRTRMPVPSGLALGQDLEQVRGTGAARSRAKHQPANQSTAN